MKSSESSLQKLRIQVATCCISVPYRSLIPSMDAKYETLKLLMDTLKEKNGLLDWNLYPQKNGKIVVKVQFKDGGSQNVNKTDLMDLQNTTSDIPMPPDMSNKDKHNFMRAKAFRENKSAKRPRSSSYSDTEIVRNSENCDDPHTLYSHVCISPEPLTRDMNSTFRSECEQQSVSVNHNNQITTNPESAADPNKLPASIDSPDSVSTIDHNNTPAPFDVENLQTPFDEEESLYDPDENPFHPTNENDEKDLTPCRDADCHYSEEPYVEFNWKRFRAKTNIYTCKLCGRKICNWCTWAKRRHLIHLEHFRNYSYEPPEGRRVDIKQLMAGRY